MYIVDLACISPQPTFTNLFLEQAVVINHEGNQYEASEPNYQGLIAASALRRMAKALRMGVGTGATLLHRNEPVDGIIIGTAYGGLDHCLLFLNQIVEYKESTLTPTHFVQSTANNIASQLSVLSNNTGYNSTHVHKGLAFEAALIESGLLLQDATCRSILVGATEEISAYNFSIDEQSGLYKEKDATDSSTLLASATPGTVCGEGASMFVVTQDYSEKALAKVVAVEIINEPESYNEVVEVIQNMLKQEGLTSEEVANCIVGTNGDCRTDHWYTDVTKALFPQTPCITFKQWTGDYPTASAFAVWLGTQMLSQNELPEFLPNSKGPILLYNHFNAIQHGLILLHRPS